LISQGLQWFFRWILGTTLFVLMFLAAYFSGKLGMWAEKKRKNSKNKITRLFLIALMVITIIYWMLFLMIILPETM
jgi:hypothetical protein